MTVSARPRRQVEITVVVCMRWLPAGPEKGDGFPALGLVGLEEKDDCVFYAAQPDVHRLLRYHSGRGTRVVTRLLNLLSFQAKFEDMTICGWRWRESFLYAVFSRVFESFDDICCHVFARLNLLVSFRVVYLIIYFVILVVQISWWLSSLFRAQLPFLFEPDLL